MYRVCTHPSIRKATRRPQHPTLRHIRSPKASKNPTSSVSTASGRPATAFTNANMLVIGHLTIFA